MTSEGHGLKRAAAAVAGVAEADLGLVPRHMTPTDLMAQAPRCARWTIAA
ncbi:MAG: hypothetical protein ACREUX_07340 [Burkholderiales bacterium]